MQSYLIQSFCLFSIIFIPFISAPTSGEKYEMKRDLEENFIEKFGYADVDMILRNELRNLSTGARAYLCNQLVYDRTYHTGDFPLIETWYIAFRRNQNSILAEVLSCSNTLSLYEGIDDTGNCYVLKKKRIKKLMKVLPPAKSDPYRISTMFSYDVDELKSTHYELPPPIVQRSNQHGSYEIASSSGSGSSSRHISRENSQAHPIPSAPPLQSPRWPFAASGMRSRNKTEEQFRLLR